MPDPRPLTIVATDSGLGGLSVVAALVPRLRATSVRRARVIFFNARPSPGGYHGMDRQQQARVFDRALRCMCQRHQPDAVLIACHTLCAVYPHTPFAAAPAAPVHGIARVSTGIIRDRLTRAPHQSAILLATPTTHHAGLYPQALGEQGIEVDRLLCIDVPRLAGAIERGGDGSTTQAIIDDAARRARAATADPAQPHVLCLLCTHYPYIAAEIRSAMEARGLHIADMIDPNAQMAIDYVQTLPAGDGGAPPEVELRVESQVRHDEATKHAIAPLLARDCPDTAAALEHDFIEPELFEIA